jgi:hypothetical protein
MHVELLIFVIVLVGSVFAETHVYVKDAGSETEVKPTVFKMWIKARECESISPVTKSDGANYTATLKSIRVGSKNRVSYILADPHGKVIAAKTVIPKNAAKYICKAVKSDEREVP